MRLLVTGLVMLVLGPASLAAQEIGAFFTKVNTYAFTAGPSEGKRILLRSLRSFPVVNLTTDNEDRLWLQVIHPRETRKVEGTGWSALSPHELLNAANQPVEVYAKVVGRNGSAALPIMIAAADLELLNVTQASDSFPEITWQQVRYGSKVPQELWLRDATGFFRPGKTAEFLSRVHAALVSRDLPKDKLYRLLAGVIRVGDSTWEVEHALGQPLRAQEEATDAAKRTLWQYPSLVVRFENQVVQKIN